MSLENVKRFLEAAAKDEALRQRLGTAREPKDLVRIAVQTSSERGLPFTEEEFVASVRPRPAGELSDDELEGVAGGTGLSPSQQAQQENFNRLLEAIDKAQDGPRLRSFWDRY